MNNYNVIADVQAEYKTLIALLEQMPPDAIPLSLGDMIDRAHDSALVVEFFKQNGKAIKGNHEEMMLDYYAKQQSGVYGDKFDHSWLYNGGLQTKYDYEYNHPELLQPHLEWLASLPTYIETDKYLLTHAPLHPDLELDVASNLTIFSEDSIVWNRNDELVRRPKINIYGHNARFKEYVDEQGLYALCLDHIARGELCGIHLPTGKIYRQPVIRLESEKKKIPKELQKILDLSITENKEN